MDQVFENHKTLTATPEKVNSVTMTKRHAQRFLAVNCM